MLECGRLIADCQIVKPLVENQIYQTCLVETPEFGLTWMHLFNADVFPDEKVRQKFKTVADTLLGQTFPGICTLLKAETGEEYTYALYPLPVGQPLTDLLNPASSVRQALEIVRQVAECLSSAHRAEQWHGNLSLATIYVDDVDGGSLMLADFALSSLVRLDFNSGVDPSYSSPELVRGEPLGLPSDLYSLGIVLFRLLTGTLPFTGDQPFTIAMQHLQGESPLLPVSLALCQPLLDSLLLAMPEQRITVEVLVEKLDQLLLLPEIDELNSLPLLTPAEVPVSFHEGRENSEVDAEAVAAEAAASADKIASIVASDVATRIERRLQERATALQLSALDTDSERVDTARMVAINRQDGPVKKMMHQDSYQKKSGPSRFLLLTLLGVAIGAIFYLLIFEQRPETLQVYTAAAPVALTKALEEGRLQLQGDNLAAAEKTFLALVERFPGFPQPHNNLAVVYALQGQLDAARAELEQALATDVGYATVYRNLGTVYAEMARDSYGRALQLKKGQQPVSLLMFAADGPLPLPLDKPTRELVPTPVVEPGVEPAAADQSPTEKLPGEAGVLVGSSTAEPKAVETLAVVAVPPSAQEPAAEISLAPELESAELFLQRWAAAWTAQNFESYLAFYADSFIPSSGKSREDWANSRQARLSKPTMIEVTLEDFVPRRLQGDKMQLEVTQTYRSDRFADRTRKLFDLQRAGDQWKILRERSLGRVP